MRLRTPPGRAGRLWLRHRIETAGHAADLLEHKRRELEAELRRLEAVRSRAAHALQAAVAEAARSLAFVDAAVATGQVGAAASFEGAATLEVDWRNVVGVRYPIRAQVGFGPPARLSMFPGGAALAEARDAHRRALEAAVASAAAEAAHGRVRAEWERTSRTARALDLEVLPSHRAALAALELRLDEEEREDVTRVRWARSRSRTVGGRPHG